jgi:hypothetical protein
MFSCQARLRSAALTIAIVAPVMAAHAQTSPAAVGHDTAGRSFHLRLGGGIAVSDQIGNTDNALIGVDWQPRNSRFSLRMGIDYSRRESNYERLLAEFPQMCDGLCTKSLVLQLAGVSLDGRFDLMTTRLRPYVVSGISVNRAMRDDEGNMQCDANWLCVQTPPGQFAVIHRTAAPALGMHGGAGLSLQVGRSQLFTEFRYQILKNPYWGNENKPMMLGVRF